MENVRLARPQPSLFAGLYSEYESLRAEFARRRQIAKSIETLEKMTDRQLRDIGVARHRIRQRAHENTCNQAHFDRRG